MHRTNVRAEQSHAKDVQFLPPHVLAAHVDDALKAEKSANCRGCNPVLSRARFGDDAALAHAPSQQPLTETVVDLVRAGVEQIFAFEIDARSAEFLGQA